MAFHQGTSGPEYLVAYKWSAAVRLCKVNASTGAKISCASPVPSGVTQAQVDIAAVPATGESLLVWGDANGIRARRLTQSGGTNGAVLPVIAPGTNPAVTFDEGANVYRVAWQASGNVMTAAVPRSSGSAQSVGTISSPGAEPDVSYNPWLGETLFVWAGSDVSIHGRSMTGGNPGPIFQVSSGVILVGEDRYPSAAPDGTRSGWVAAWQRGILGHAMLSIVPQGATGNLSGNRSVSGDLVTGEFYPAAAMRGDGAALIALQRGAPGLEVAVYTVDDLGGPANVGWHYGYDALGRLTSACSQWSGSVCVGDQWTYTYDGAGNPTRFDRWNPSTGQVETIRYIYNGANQVECIDADASGACNGTEFWTYDAHGNLTFDRTTRYVYDAANHLATVCDSGDGLTCDALGNETTYQYNGDGARVAQSVRKGILPATVTTYTLDTALPLTQVLSETTSGQTTRYLHGLDLIAQSDGTATEYLAYDGLGSVRQLVDGSGAVLTSQTFDPYGTPYSVDEQADSSFSFTGEQVDENGLVYLRARYYNPAQGRFMQGDPSRLESNGYQYAGSSPTMYTDPSGNICIGGQYYAWPFPEWTCEGNRIAAESVENINRQISGNPLLLFDMSLSLFRDAGNGILYIDRIQAGFPALSRRINNNPSYYEVRPQESLNDFVQGADAVVALQADLMNVGLGSSSYLEAAAATGALTPVKIPGLTADEYALLGLNADEIVTLASRWQSAEEAAVIVQGQTSVGIQYGTTGVVNRAGQITRRLPYNDRYLLARMARQFRLENNPLPNGRPFIEGNVAVFEYFDTRTRTLRHVVNSNVKDEIHAELRIMETLNKQGVLPEQVTRIYSEYHPCSSAGSQCYATLQNVFPQAQIYYSFPYDQQGHWQLRQAVERLLFGE